MANQLPNEEELFDEIRRAGISLDPRLWQILSHHIGNDIQVIHLGARCLSEMPSWIRYTYTLMLKIHKKFNKGFNFHDVGFVCMETMERVENISMLLDKLRATVKYDTEPKKNIAVQPHQEVREL